MSSIMSRIATFLLLAWVYTASTMCPMDCFCGLDERGRRKTSCLQGGLIGPIQVTTIDKSTQVLEIKAPKDTPNWLVIGPFFQSLVSLEELRISRSGLPEIGKHSFWGIKNLEILELAENNISALQDHNFRGLANLKELYLEDNQIDYLASGTFKYLTDLRVLSLARNKLQEVMHRVFERLSKLQRLNLSGNQLVELHPEIFMDVQELQVLECRRCGLRNVNTQIYHLLQQLTTLDLGENEFYYISNDEFHELRRLKHLWLDGNHLPVVLERTFIMQRELQKVSFARNRLAKVTDLAFANVTTLSDLDLSYNKFVKMEAATFHPLADSLKKLDVSGNAIPLMALRGLIQGVVGLQHLVLADMNVTEVPSAAFTFHEKLVSLNLSGNQLEEFPHAALAPLAELRDLDLSRNKLKGLDEEAVRRVEPLGSLRLAGNPWQCDACHALPVWRRVRADNTSVLRGVRCAGPRLLRGRTLEVLRDGELAACGAGSQPDADLSHLVRRHANVILIVATALAAALLLVGSVACVRALCFRRHAAADLYALDEDKRDVRPAPVFESATAVFGQNGEISFKFPLELEPKAALTAIAAISTIDVKKDAKQLPNGDL